MCKFILGRCILLLLTCAFFCHASYAKGIFDFMLKGEDKPAATFDEEKNVSEFFDGHRLQLENSSFASLGEAKLIAINKISASSQKLTVKVNTPIFFHNIEIHLHKYVKSKDPYRSESYALVTITEHKASDDPKIIFQGWLIEGRPSVSTLNSPVYEVFIQES
jgi:hypothetical protein